ncbi:MAG: extracellular solute-binding protein, partial [Chloroflexi bacterium]
MSKRLTWLIALFIVLALTVVACGGQAPPAEQAPAEQAPAEEAAAPAEKAPAEEAAAPAEEAPADTSGVTEINILWAQWDPADYLQEIGNMYEEQTGIKVNVIQEPWGSFGDLFFTEMSAQGTSYDMVVGDSQWLGQGATQGHYLDMTDFLVS